MEKLNKKLAQEFESPFHAYLLLGNTSSHLLKQAKIFASKILFGIEEEIEHPDIKVVSSENLNTLGVEDIRNIIENDGLVPIEGEYKVVIFPPVKSLTEEASNAIKNIRGALRLQYFYINFKWKILVSCERRLHIGGSFYNKKPV